MYPMGYNAHMRVRNTEVYRDWINSLQDRAVRARIQVRVDRLVHGPGYRVYYTERGGTLIVLLAGGDKSTQAQDIKTAVFLAKNLGVSGHG